MRPGCSTTNKRFDPSGAEVMQGGRSKFGRKGNASTGVSAGVSTGESSGNVWPAKGGRAGKLHVCARASDEARRQTTTNRPRSPSDHNIQILLTALGPLGCDDTLVRRG